MNHQTMAAASSPISPQAHPLLRTLRTELSALEVEAIKAANQKQNRKSQHGYNINEINHDNRYKHRNYRTDEPPTLIIDDNNPMLVNVCKTLENVFRHGAIQEDKRNKFELIDLLLHITRKQSTAIGYPGSISNHIRLNGLVVKAIEEITNCSSKPSHTAGSSSAFHCLKTNKGQTRFLLRAALKHHWMLNICESAKTFPEINLFYRKDALILQDTGNEGEETLWNTLECLSYRYKFDLNLSNRAFLDLTWELPDFRSFELVPVTDLGLMIAVIKGHVIVSQVKQYSVAGEDHKVEVGDIISEIDGKVTHAMTPEMVAKVVKSTGGKRPINMSVTKTHSKECKVYLPAVTLLASANFDVRELEKVWLRNMEDLQANYSGAKSKHRKKKKSLNQLDDYSKSDEELDELIGLLQEHELKENDIEEEDEEDDKDDDKNNLFSVSKGHIDGMVGEVDKFMARGGYHVLYIGSVQVGSIGDKSLLDGSIHRVANDGQRVHHPVSLHLMEFGTRMYCVESGRQVLYYPYPKISACGCSTANNHYLAFIAGDNVCSLSTNFLCHVFYSSNKQVAEDIISSMAAGFRRTHHAA